MKGALRSGKDPVKIKVFLKERRLVLRLGEKKNRWEIALASAGSYSSVPELFFNQLRASRRCLNTATSQPRLRHTVS
jgi:hypothetical protein